MSGDASSSKNRGRPGDGGRPGDRDPKESPGQSGTTWEDRMKQNVRFRPLEKQHLPPLPEGEGPPVPPKPKGKERERERPLLQGQEEEDWGLTLYRLPREEGSSPVPEGKE